MGTSPSGDDRCGIRAEGSLLVPVGLVLCRLQRCAALARGGDRRRRVLDQPGRPDLQASRGPVDGVLRDWDHGRGVWAVYPGGCLSPERACRLRHPGRRDEVLFEELTHMMVSRTRRMLMARSSI